MNDIKPYLTTTVGLITSADAECVNVMAAEWTYFVSTEPLYIAVGLSDRTLTQEIVLRTGEFGVTLCTEEQAGLADFVGSVSGTEVDKLSSLGLELVESKTIHAPRAAGGVLSAECLVRESVRLPGYVLVIGEAVEVDLYPERLPDVLVKHGSMFRLGAKIETGPMFVAATFLPESETTSHPTLRIVGATRFARPSPSAVEVFLRSKNGQTLVHLGSAAPNQAGDVWMELDAAELRGATDPDEFMIELRTASGEQCVAEIARRR